MALRIYNTLSRKIEEFRPLSEGKVKMYVCGPTVYNYLHIGNFRGPIFFNLVCNWLEYFKYEVTYVFNYTDVDDKIIQRAHEEGLESQQISEKYIQSFEEDFGRLGLREHDYRPKVTNFIGPIVDFVQELIDKGMAYVEGGQVFYRINHFPNYGKLSGKKLEDLIAGWRVEVDESKAHSGDFVLWKPAKEGEPAWDSPWGKGRPGWHIECSTMIQQILGETIDIHGGGIGLIFPHHENEIAQGEGRTERPYCKYWMHHDFINMNDEKMSKSLGNIILARDFMDRYHPEILKYLVLSIHYRSSLNINWDKIVDAMAALNRIYQSLAVARRVLEDGAKMPSTEGKAAPALLGAMKKAEVKIIGALNDDFNTGTVMAAFFDVVRTFNSLQIGEDKVMTAQDRESTAQIYTDWIIYWGQFMSLFNESPFELLENFQQILLTEKKIDRQRVEVLVAERKIARAERNWTLADSIREELAAMGIELTDGLEGREWNVILN